MTEGYNYALMEQVHTARDAQLWETTAAKAVGTHVGAFDSIIGQIAHDITPLQTEQPDLVKVVVRYLRISFGYAVLFSELHNPQFTYPHDPRPALQNSLSLYNQVLGDPICQKIITAVYRKDPEEFYEATQLTIEKAMNDFFSPEAQEYRLVHSFLAALPDDVSVAQ